MSDVPIPAATLVVVRDRSDGPPHLLMVERASGMAFAGGALVFPGGRIDQADRDLAAPLGHADGAARIAAIRETIEETAVAVGIGPLPSAEVSIALQDALVADRPLSELLDHARLALAVAALTPLARWLPNFHVTRRFDTLFFIARAPPGEWQPRVIEGECSGAFWLTAADATPSVRREVAVHPRSHRAALQRAIVEVEPYTRSKNLKIAKGAILAKNVFEARQQLCDRWMALYVDMGKSDAVDEQIADRIVALRAQIGFVGQELGESAIAASWGMVKIDPQGKAHSWAITWGDRRAALKRLRETFGKDISKGPKPGHNYIETAAGALASFLSRDDWEEDMSLPTQPRKHP